MGHEYVLYVRVEQYGLAMDANKNPKTKQELNWTELRMSIRTQRLKKRYKKIFCRESSFSIQKEVLVQYASTHQQLSTISQKQKISTAAPSNMPATLNAKGSESTPAPTILEERGEQKKGSVWVIWSDWLRHTWWPCNTIVDKSVQAQTRQTSTVFAGLQQRN